MPAFYKYQEDAVAKLLTLGGKGGLFLEMGTGKTRTALEIARRKGARSVLVVTPISSDGVDVWDEEARTLNMDSVVDCTLGSVPSRARRLASLAGRAELTIAAVGWESYWREPLRSAIVKWHPDAVIYDEAHKLVRRSSKQSLFAGALARDDAPGGSIPIRLGLTGTPAPNGPENYYALFRALEPTLFGTRWAEFEARYILKGGFGGHQIVGYRDLEDLEAKVTSNSYRITKAEALDLPPQVDARIPITLMGKGREVYEKLRKHAIADVSGVQGTGTALSKIVITNILRLQQVTSGFVKVTDGRLIDFSSEKRASLESLLERAYMSRQRCVVFCRFTHDVDEAMRIVGEIAGEDNAFRLDAHVPRGPRRREELQGFRASKAGVLVAQMQVASLQIDLSCAHVAVFFSPDYSLTNYLQARDRLHRHGQKHKVTYYHLVAKNTVDEKIYAALEKKENLLRSLLDKRRLSRFFDAA